MSLNEEESSLSTSTVTLVEKKPAKVKHFKIDTGPEGERNEIRAQGSWELLTLGILFSVFDPISGELTTQVELRPGGKVIDIVLPNEGLCIEVHGLFWDWLKLYKKAALSEKTKAEIPSLEELKARYIAVREKALQESEKPFTEILFAFSPPEIIELLLNNKLFRDCLNPRLSQKHLVTRFIRAAGSLNKSGKVTFTMVELREVITRFGLVVETIPENVPPPGIEPGAAA